MNHKYKIRDNQGIYFITLTVVGWVELFIRNYYRDCMISSFEYCKREKGLQIHAYVIMTSHIHMIISSKDSVPMMPILRDMKRFTSKQLVNLISTEAESRKEWMLKKFSYEAQRTKRGKNYILWQEGYHAKQIETISFLEQKLHYLHENPVEGGFVSQAEDYLYSSARNYAGEKGMMDVNCLR